MTKRIIKFRAWNTKKKEMVYLESNVSYSDFKDFELMQFIGVYDKNGKEIYEDDVLFFENEHLKRYSRVVWNSKECRHVQKVTLHFNSTKHPEKVGCFNNLTNSLDKMEIIGNIYENQELLKKERKRGKPLFEG